MTKIYNQLKYIRGMTQNNLKPANGRYWTKGEITTTVNTEEGEENFLDPKQSKKNKLRVCSKALHPEFSNPLIDVAEMSLEKGYEPLNWLDPKNHVTTTYLIEAAQRHLDQIKMGIDINTEEKTLSGEYTKNQPYHAAQVAYNCLMLCRQMLEGVEIDDRLFKDGVRK